MSTSKFSILKFFNLSESYDDRLQRQFLTSQVKFHHFQDNNLVGLGWFWIFDRNNSTIK